MRAAQPAPDAVVAGLLYETLQAVAGASHIDHRKNEEDKYQTCGDFVCVNTRKASKVYLDAVWKAESTAPRPGAGTAQEATQIRELKDALREALDLLPAHTDEAGTLHARGRKLLAAAPQSQQDAVVEALQHIVDLTSGHGPRSPKIWYELQAEAIAALKAAQQESHE